MSADGAQAQQTLAPPLPRSIWVVAWASLAGQAVLLFQRGVRSDDGVSLIGSVVLGAVVLGYVSAGVVRARTARTVVALAVLTLATAGELVTLATTDDAGRRALMAASLAPTVVALGGLVAFRRTGWYAWQRTRPPAADGARVGRLVGVGVVVGALGGLIAPADDGVQVDVEVADQVMGWLG